MMSLPRGSLGGGNAREKNGGGGSKGKIIKIVKDMHIKVIDLCDNLVLLFGTRSTTQHYGGALVFQIQN